jgi:hypothetical protein
MVKLNNLEVACLFLLLNGPARAVTIQKAMFTFIKGPIVGPGPFRWYSEYFRPPHTAGYNSGSRYTMTSLVRKNVRTALWWRDEKTMMWALTALGKAKAYSAKWKLEQDKNCRIKLPV